MAAVFKQDSNVTGLRYAEELSYKILPVTPIWYPLEPNSYLDMGGSITTVARNPINASRQSEKGVVTGNDASGGINSDLTQTNMQDLMQGFIFADFRRKGEELVTAVDVDTTNPDEYQVASTTGFQVGDLIQGQNFTNTVNNAVNLVTAIVSDTSVEVLDGQLVDEASPPADARIVSIGHQATSGDLDVVTTGTWPVIFSNGTLDFTTLGLTPGEWIFVGGDGAGEEFANEENNGFKRVRSATATELTIDKSSSTMVAETGTGLTVNLYLGRVLKNELGSLIKRRTYNLERTLGAPDSDLPAEIQAEYLEGAVPSEMKIIVPTEDKMTIDLSFIAADSSTIDGPTDLKDGTRPSLVKTDAFNTSSDFTEIKMAEVIEGNEAPDSYFAFLQSIDITVNNNVSPVKAVGVLGAFEVSVGNFEVGGSVTAYFSDVGAMGAVRDNTDTSLHMISVKSNAGIALDLPLMALGDGRPNVEQNEVITLPLDMMAATAAKIDSTLDYTMMMVFFDYLPNAADV